MMMNDDEENIHYLLIYGQVHYLITHTMGQSHMTLDV